MSRMIPQSALALRAAILLAVAAIMSSTAPRAEAILHELCIPNAVRMTPKPGCNPGCQHSACISIMPGTVVAPVGAEVVMVAGVCGHDGYLHSDQRVEWMIDPSSEGFIVDVGNGTFHDHLRKWHERAHKVDNTFAVGRTVHHGITLTRGTPAPEDDVPVLPGQAWITVTSSREGTSDVTAFAPDVFGWDARLQRARIHWVDATWMLPPAATNPVGTRHVMTTTVVRQSDQTPIQGYRVRYEVQGGPAAGFAPDCSPTIEVPTNELGQASVELFQQSPAPGTNIISIQIIRPADFPGGDGRRLVLGTGSTQKTWVSNDLALRISGPAQAAVGGNAVYRIEIHNPSGSAARDIVVSDQLPAGMSFVSSQPPTQAATGRLEWRFAEIGPRQTQTIEVTLRADQPGTVQNCVTVASAAGVTARECATTTVLASGLEVRMTGPPQAQAGETVNFEVTVTNRGGTPATGIVIVDRYDPGFEHATRANPIERNLPDLGPGASRTIAVQLRALQPGQQCNRVEVLAAGGLSSSAQACVNVTGTPIVAPPPVVPGEEPPPTTPNPAQIKVEKTGPTLRNVGGVAEFTIRITNIGSVRVTNLKVVDNYDPGLNPVMATDGRYFIGNDLAWSIDGLDPGRSALLEVHCRCTQAAAQTCNRVTVTTDQGARADDDACLEVRPVQGGLTMTVSDTRDPVTVGGDVTYEVVVRNTAQTPDSNVAVSVTLPTELSPVSTGTQGPSAHTIVGQAVTFQPVAQIPAGGTLTYQVQARANQAGQARVTATLNSQSRMQALTADETTAIFTQR
ncbi:MAG: DUF11 domain-containing protein [Pirellulales bacterium]|nr:DUF11 domain-containing protein [Pirellulales bacterium]